MNDHTIIPLPAQVSAAEGAFTLTADSAITVDPASPELLASGGMLAGLLNELTGYTIPVQPVADSPASGRLALSLDAAADLGAEGYELTIAPDGVTLIAEQPAGLFYGVQTLRQLLETGFLLRNPVSTAGTIPAGTIRDTPRFAWRGLMLDVSRHFFGVADVKRVIDLAATYKLNRLHLHLSDDQGWRIEIKSWPELTRAGGQTAVGGAPGGYYTQADYADIVAYAATRYITIVPEIDLPGHTNAALNAYPELNCDGVAPAPYTGTEVGFSSLCLDKEITYQFIDDVVGELAALTPGDFIHVGGDEAHATPKEGYIAFIERVQDIVAAHGKRMVGWEEIGQSRLSPTTIAQHWVGGYSPDAARQGAKLILSPATKIYVDMKYDESTPLGLNWAGYSDVRTSYDWEPATLIPGVGEDAILGVEAALWTETLTTMDDIEVMVFPRLLGLAEIGWSPAAGRGWATYRERLAAHGPRLEALGVDFYRAAEVDWE